MATSHLLLSVASRKPDLSAPKMPDGAVYRRDSGFWTVGDDGGDVPMVSHAAYRRNPQTKKADVETGEDQKGE